MRLRLRLRGFQKNSPPEILSHKGRTLQRTKKKTERGDLPVSNTQNGAGQPKRDPAFIQYTWRPCFSFRSFLDPL